MTEYIMLRTACGCSRIAEIDYAPTAMRSYFIATKHNKKREFQWRARSVRLSDL